MSLTVNKATLSYALDDRKAYAEMIEFLNEAIQDELKKADSNCDFIDECINAIDELQTLGEDAALHHSPNNKRIRFSKRTRAVIAAALVAVIGSTAVLNASPALADSVKGFFETVFSSLQTGAEETENIENLSSIYATAPDSAEVHITRPEDVDETKIMVTAVYQDGTAKVIPIESCKVTKSVEQDENERYVFITISYGGSACTVAYEMEDGQ